jgi:hypothetical protein
MPEIRRKKETTMLRTSHGRALGAFPGLLLMLGACSAPAGDTGEATGTEQSAVSFTNKVTGYTNDSTPPTSKGQQEETAIDFSVGTSDAIEIVAYNDQTGLTDPTYVPGQSLLGWSYSTGSTWTHKKLSPSATSAWPIYVGDPSIAVLKNSPSTVYITNLAIPSTKLSSPTNGADNLGGAIVAQSTNRGQDFTFYQGLKNTAGDTRGDQYDGTSLATGNNLVVAGFLDVTTSRTDVWRKVSTGAFTLMPSPFPASYPAETHARVAIDSFNRTFVSTVVKSPDGWNCVALNFANPSGTWQSSYAPDGTCGVIPEISDEPGRQPLYLSDRFLRSQTFAIAVGNETSSQTEMRVAYTVYADDAHYHVCVDAFHMGAGITPSAQGGCAHWITPSGSDQIHPALTFGGGKWKLTYWGRNDDPKGNKISLYQATVPAWGNTSQPLAITRVVGPQVACPLSSGYWSDYDGVKYNSTDGKFYATYTDSTGGCPGPGHVSQVSFQ